MKARLLQAILALWCISTTLNHTMCDKMGPMSRSNLLHCSSEIRGCILTMALKLMSKSLSREYMSLPHLTILVH